MVIATGNTCTPSPSPSVTTTYDVRRTGGACNVTTSCASLQIVVNTIPSVTVQPPSNYVCEGGSAEFTVAIAGTPSSTYQWQSSIDGGFTWSDISGATNYSLLLPSVTTSMNGYRYRIVATNSCGATTSDGVAGLTVYTPPSITTQPADRSGCADGRVTFDVAATGDPVPTYYWELSGDGGITWWGSGVTGPSITIDISGHWGFKYRAIVSNTCASITSNPATLEQAPASDGSRKMFGMFTSGDAAEYTAIEDRVTGTSAPPDRLTVAQTYNNYYELNGWCLNFIHDQHARGNVVQLYIWPNDNGWPHGAGGEDWDGMIATFAQQLAQELGAMQNTIPGILVSIGPEMNGTWTNYGCSDNYTQNHAAEFLALHNGIVTILRNAIQNAGLNSSMLRIVWGPNFWPGPLDGTVCSYTVYWPGWSYIDFLGYSDYSITGTYRSGQQVAQTARTMLQDIGANINDPAYRGKVIILQTGMEYGQVDGQGQPLLRSVWISDLFNAVVADQLFSGMILFQANGKEPLLRWAEYPPSTTTYEGFDTLHQEIGHQTRFMTDIRFLFCN
jgi:hypothetical protein